MKENVSFWQKYQIDAWSFRKPEWPEADCESDEFIDAGIVGESGEIAEHVKKKLRGDYRGQIAINPRYFDELCVGELGDTLWYLFAKLSTRGIRFDSISDTVLRLASVESLKKSTLTAHCVDLSRNAISFIDATNTPDSPGRVHRLYPISLGMGITMLKLSELAVYFGSSLEAVAIGNIFKCSYRKENKIISGSGDFR